MKHSRNQPQQRRLLSLVTGLLALGFILASGAATADNGVTQTGENVTGAESVVEDDRPDPSTDVLGWENGVWANATLSIDQSDGINRTELEAVVARTMARVEAVREIEFDRTPPVRLIFQQQQRNETGETTYSRAQRIRLNTQYESLFLINESRDAVESKRALFGSGVNGYYSSDNRNVTMISPNSSLLQIREGVLAQELFHAQQDNQFTLPSVETIEERNTRNGYVEGDANYVQELYEQRCNGMWSNTCYQPERDTVPRLSGLNDGMFRLFQQPYQSGHAFVRERQQQQGWEAVNALYDQPPASTEQIIHPELYREDDPTNLTVTDRSTDAWQPLRADGERVTGSVGEAGLFVSMVYPALQTDGQRSIIPSGKHRIGGFGDPVRFGYDHPVTDGWDGDQLLPYVASNKNETGYVYEIAWDSQSDARAFHLAYRKLLAYHDAKPVDGRANTYRIPEDDGFTDAFYIARGSNRTRIVNAPTVQALESISASAPPSANESRTGPPWQRVNRTWQTELSGGGFSAATTANGRIHIADSSGGVRAVNGTTGELTWQRQVGERITLAPVVSGGTAYVGTTESTVFALDAETGDIQWQESINGSVVATPTVVSDTVYVGTFEGTITALDAVTGESRWAKSVGGPVTTSPAATDAYVYATSRSNISAFERLTGDVAWNVTIDSSVVGTPTVAHETIYTATFDAQAGSGRIRALDATDGGERWTRMVNTTVPSVLTVTGDAVYAGGSRFRTASSNLSAFGRERGDRRWRVAVNESIRDISVSSGGVVYAGTASGRVYAVETASGDRQFTTDVEGTATTPVVASADTLYIGTDGGLLSALNGSTGKRQWTFVADGLAGTTPVVSDDRVYAQAGKTLYGLESSLASDGSQDDQSESPAGETPNSDNKTSQDPSGTDDDADTRSASSADDGPTAASDDGPGFGIVSAAGSLLVVTLVLVLRRL